MAELVVGPFVSFVVERLGNLLDQEGQFLGGVRGQVEQLQRELNWMQSFLKAADARREGDEIVRNWVAEIREVAYDAEDVIATFIVKLAFRSRSGKFPSVLKRYLCTFKEYGARHKVGLEIEVINNKINILTRRLQTYGIQSFTRVGESSSTSKYEGQQQLRRSYPHIEDDVVGLENGVQEVVDQLVDEKKLLRVVSIWGMGGLGKTTLAKKVYNHRDIKHHYNCIAWAYISQQCNTREVLEGILIKLVSASKVEREEIEKLKPDELAQKLHQVQSEKKCLVILDDVWKDEDWDSLSPAFPNTKKVGSKILLTTPNKEVAKHIDQQCSLYPLRHLTQEESWKLFEKKISQRREEEFTLSTEWIELGKEMVRHCGGLLLAIVVLGGLLATKHKLNEWETVCTNISHYLGKGKGQGGVPVQDILALSYQDLPYHLKACFLCLSHLPEDHVIRPEKLIQIWMAEGIVLSPIPTRAREMNEEVSMLDVGMSYLSKLVQRCMIQVQLTKFSEEIELCRLHDLMRDLCLLKAKEENFLKIVRIEAFGDRFVWADSTSSSSSSSSLTTTIRRLVVYGLGEREGRENVSSGNGHEEMKKHHHIRSCQFYWFNWQLRSSSWRQIKSFLKGLTLLTILDLEGIVFSGKSGMLPRATGNLIHLRFLSVRNSCIKSIPSSIGNLRFLQTLDLHVRWVCNVRIPNVLWKLEQLRHLYLPLSIKQFCVGKLRLDGLNKLEILKPFDTRHCDVRCFPKLTNLQNVEVRLVGPKDLAVILKSPILNNSNWLLQYFVIRIVEYFQTEEEKSLLRQLLGCHHPHQLDLLSPLNLVKLPDQFPPNLTYLTLSNIELEEDPMPTLEKFPNLRTLILWKNSYIGKEMVCTAPTTTTTPTTAPSSSSIGSGGYSCDGGFPQLKYLYLRGIENLEEWRVEEGAMPTLFHLEIDECRKLKEIPNGLRLITTLQELEIYGASKVLKDRVREGVEDFYIVQHVASILIC